MVYNSRTSDLNY